VRYIERVGGAASDAGDALIGVPSDPAPGRASKPRLTPIALGTTPWGSGEYKYDGAGNIISIGTDNYLYYGVQRLKQSSTRGVAETYTYDGFGNMTAKTNNGSSQPIPSVQAATNRYTGGDYTYNVIGAMKTGANYTFEYDAFGQPLSKKYNNDSSTQEYYLYTPGDERIGVQRGSWWTWSVRDEGGKVLRQYRSSTTNPSAPSLWLEDFVWRDGLLLGSQRPPEMGGRRHYHLDHLGTPRLVTADNGQRISAHDYFPFGDEATAVWQEVAAGFDREDPLKFTGHERDYAGGMGGEDGHAIDDMHARYESPTLGRFVSVDPILGNLLNPQRWNRYAYVLNNPVNRVDPQGLDDCPPGQPVPPGGCHIDAPEGGANYRDRPSFFWDRWMDHTLVKPEFFRSRAKVLYAKAIAYSGPLHHGRTPDAYSMAIGATGPWFLGGGGLFTLDRYGRLYAGPYGAIGTPGESGGVTAIWLDNDAPPSADNLDAFISGWSLSSGGGYGVEYERTWGGPGLGFSNEVGVGVPGVGVVSSWSLSPIETGLSWRP
jgi:RHS repeat-associated protein